MHRPDGRILLAGAMMVARGILALALIALAACSAPASGGAQAPLAVTAPASVVAPVDAAVESGTSTIATVSAPVIGAIRDTVGDMVTLPVQDVRPRVSPAAVNLIVRWEVSGPSYYTSKLQRPIWPGGASGITWGVGYDGGQQSRALIASDWVVHPQVDRLVDTSGIAGAAARAALPGFSDIVTPYDMASRVFGTASLPQYYALTRRAFRPESFDRLPADAQGGLVSLVYNRGASMTGDARREMRAIRDECLPTGDVRCIASQLRAMCRLWAGTPNANGLCNRRIDEARLVESVQ